MSSVTPGSAEPGPPVTLDNRHELNHGSWLLREAYRPQLPLDLLPSGPALLAEEIQAARKPRDLRSVEGREQIMVWG